MIRHLIGLVAILPLTVLAPARAAAPEAEGQDAEARRIFNDVLQAYKALPSYADEGSFTVEMKVNGRPQSDRRPMSLAFARPNRIRLDAGSVRLVGNAETLATVIVPDRKYMVDKASPTIAPALLMEGPLGAALRGGPAGPAASHLLNSALPLTLLVDNDPAATILEGTKALGSEPDAQLDGKAVKVLRLRPARGPTLRLLVDPDTRLLRRAEMVITPSDLDAKVPGVTLSDARVAWESGAITTTPPDDKTFAFEAPKDYAAVAPVELGKKSAKGGADEPTHELVGKPAPDFTLTVLDGPGKTKTLTRADLAGKVVMIDFWATWCGPCLMELPEVAKLVKSYARARKDVVILAVSQDKEPEDLKGVRKLVEATLAEEGLELALGQVGKIALDPTHAVGTAFGVQGIPMVVILDGKGIVQAVHVGYRPEVGELLSSDIDTLLEGKPLVTPRTARPE